MPHDTPIPRWHLSLESVGIGFVLGLFAGIALCRLTAAWLGAGG
jgi:hypothetical protein